MPKTSGTSVVDFSKRLANINHDIAEIASDCARDVKTIKILAVSKGHSFEAIKIAYECGLRDFGESYAQEMSVKIRLAQEHEFYDIVWHFIGGIQSNKIKNICQADFIHSVASVNHANIIGRKTPEVKKIFCQVNLGQERAGFSPTEIIDVVQSMVKIKNIQVVGLMTILPLMPSHPPEFWFEQMCEIKERVLASGVLADVQLSMGMSSDFLAAIKYGANIVRIGSALFGARDETPDIFAV